MARGSIGVRGHHASGSGTPRHGARLAAPSRAPLVRSRLARLWQTRDAQRRPEELVELGKMYGCALIRRGDMADRNLTHSVFQELLPRVSDPSQRNLLTALTSLSLRFGL